VDTWIIMKRWS